MMGQMYHERGEYSPALSALHKALESINQDGDNAYAESNVQNTLLPYTLNQRTV